MIGKKYRRDRSLTGESHTTSNKILFECVAIENGREKGLHSFLRVGNFKRLLLVRTGHLQYKSVCTTC